MDKSGSDYWKERYEHAVLGKPPPKEIYVKAVPFSSVLKDSLSILKTQFNKNNNKGD
jgi:hypothetical protein